MSELNRENIRNNMARNSELRAIKAAYFTSSCAFSCISI